MGQSGNGEIAAGQKKKGASKLLCDF